MIQIFSDFHLSLNAGSGVFFPSGWGLGFNLKRAVGVILSIGCIIRGINI